MGSRTQFAVINVTSLYEHNYPEGWNVGYCHVGCLTQDCASGYPEYRFIKLILWGELRLPKLKNLYPEQTYYFKNVVSSGLFCDSLTYMADQLLDLYSEYMCLLLCVRFKPCIKILCVASKIFCYNRVHFMLTVKGETGWCYTSCVSLVNIAQCYSHLCLLK